MITWKPRRVPEFLPFAALRYAMDDLESVIAPPYDVLSDAQVDELTSRSVHNIVRVDVPRGRADRYDRAAQTLRDWVSDGVLVTDDRPSLTIYRMRFTDAGGAARDIAGVMGGLEVVDEGAGGVLPHERTTPKASTDRLDLTRATQANLSPVWGLSLAAGLTELLAEPGEPVGRVVEDTVEHVVERVVDPGRIAAIQQVLAADDVLIADGHHRYSISRTYRDDVRAATGRCDGPAEQTLAFVSELVADQLSVEAIHRLYDGIDFDELYDALGRSFALTAVDRPDAATLAAMEADGLPGAGRTGRGLAARRAARPVRGRTRPGRSVAGDRARRRCLERELSARTGRGAGRGRRGPRDGCGADPPGQRGGDRADRAGGIADATQVDLLHPEAQDRIRDPPADLTRLSPRTALVA